MNKWLILLACCAFLIASMLTSGIVRSFIDLSAFIAMLVLVLNLANSVKAQDKE